MIIPNELSEEELIITKCLSAWYNISKEEMVNSLLNIIKENPNTNLIKRIITDLVNKLSDDPREQRLKKWDIIVICYLVTILKNGLILFKIKLLKEYKTMYTEYKKIFGNTYCTKYKDYVCLMPNGELMKPGYLSHTFSKLLEDNELKRIRLHDLRHSCATLLVQNKVPIKDIQIWLGHSNIQTTMIYTHLDETNKEVSAQVLVDKFQYILNNYNENELYNLKENTLNNIMKILIILINSKI